ncbi:hypothetical protein ACFWJ5_04895 [Streptomyces qaidamensis]|uniref:hypothetical protein n=1 Tax=Streptomyces qaidamensis TaxID=1783515 RepID=UPI00365C3B6F
MKTPGVLSSGGDSTPGVLASRGRTTAASSATATATATARYPEAASAGPATVDAR